MTSFERTCAEALAFLALVLGGVLYEQHKGAAECRAADTAAVVKQESANAARAVIETQQINHEAMTYHDAISAAPDPTPALVCVRRYEIPAMLQTAAAQPAGHAAPDLPAPSGPGFDPGPALAKVGQAADAQVVELQSYITQVCLAK